jgi:hypothetical protein
MNRARAAGPISRARFAASAAAVASAIAVSLAASLVAPAASAQPQTPSLSVDVGECVALESPDERFACYERRVAAERHGQTPAPAPRAAPPGAASTPTPAAESAPRASTASAPVSPRAVARIEENAPRRERAPDDDAVEFEGTITALRTIAPKAYEVTLDNGQVWRQVVAQQYSLEVGQHVRIYPTHWGSSYRLAASERKGFVQVKRVE